MKPSEVLTGAITAIETVGWYQGYYVNAFGNVCTLGAMRTVVTGNPRYALNSIEISEDSHTAFLEAYTALEADLGRSIPGWNDEFDQTKEGVIDQLNRTAERLKGEGR